MGLISLKNVSVAFGGPPLLDGVDLDVSENSRIGIVGRNGSGKSTLLKLIGGRLTPDSGVVTVSRSAHLTILDQDVPTEMNGSVRETVARGLGPTGGLLADYYRQQRLCRDNGDRRQRDRLARQRLTVTTKDAWRLEPAIERIISRMKLSPHQAVSDLSSGWKRRVLLAAALVSEPNLLLLDEPTNHLDLDAIGWLEELIAGFQGTLMLVTHDRMLLRRVAQTIIEIDRGRLLCWQMGYDSFCRRREASWDQEAAAQRKADKLLASEAAWRKAGLKARRARNQGRVRALERLRRLRDARRRRPGGVRLSIDGGEASGKWVIEVDRLHYRRQDKTIVKDLSCRILRGDKVGIIGPNGAGKTTLLQLLLKHLPSSEGTVRHGTRLETAYFDQLKSRLDPDLSVVDNVAEGRDRVTVEGRSWHIVSYLKDFLFSRDRIDCPVRLLSGGERSRLLLAKLFSRPANFLVLDEPTNDLDAETLELLEERLVNYNGTLLLVSHDREFLNNVVTSVLSIEAAGEVVETVGGYDDWLAHRRRAARPSANRPKSDKAERPQDAPVASRRSTGRRKLGFNEQRELAALPDRIEAMEKEQRKLYRQMSNPAFYQNPQQPIAETAARLDALEKAIAEAYGRWESLESLK